MLELLKAAHRPIFIWGAGIRAYAGEARSLARRWNVPVACTWGAIDLMHYDDPLMAGGFGTHGTRAANFAVQNADLVISVGSRLDTKATGTPAHFARGARLVMVDIDAAEVAKFGQLGRTIDVGVVSDAGAFLRDMEALPYSYVGFWPAHVRAWRQRYDKPEVTWPGVNPYEFVKQIGTFTTESDIICSDTGCALGWMMQGFPFKGERFIHAFNMTPMGYGLPAAIGASVATGRRVILVCGDGSIMMSLPELATVARWNLDIKVILFDNKGHGMCRQTQRQWLGSSYPATSIEGGLGFPAWSEMFNSFGVHAYLNLANMFMFSTPGAVVVSIPEDAALIPQAKYGQPLEDADPQLPREEFRRQMIVEPL